MSQPKFYSASFFSEEYFGDLGENAVCHLSIVSVDLREIIAIYELHQVEVGTAETNKCDCERWQMIPNKSILDEAGRR